MVLGARIGRTTAVLLAFASLAFGSVALAHEDHDKLGAGPGPAKAAAGSANAKMSDQQADARDAHGNMGTMDMDMGRDVAGDDMDMGMHHDEAAAEAKTFGERLTSWLGRVHTVVIHFPIALFVGAFAVELWGLWRRDKLYQQAAGVMLVLGALGAIVAAALGWFAGGFYLTDRNLVLMTHRWLGTAIALFGVVLVVMAARSRRKPDASRAPFLVLLGLLTLAVSVQGFLGGTFMHGGMNHLAF